MCVMVCACMHALLHLGVGYVNLILPPLVFVTTSVLAILLAFILGHKILLPSATQVIVKKLCEPLTPSSFTLCFSSTGFLSLSNVTFSRQ